MKRKKLKKPSMDDYTNAIIDKDKGIPYPIVLDSYDITPTRFFRAVTPDLSDCISYANGEYANRDIVEILNEIGKDKSRQRELLNMGEEFIHQQYDRVMGRIEGESQRKFYDGTFSHPDNIDEIVYYALVSNNTKLGSKNRAEVVDEIKELPLNLVT